MDEDKDIYCFCVHTWQRKNKQFCLLENIQLQGLKDIQLIGINQIIESESLWLRSQGIKGTNVKKNNDNAFQVVVILKFLPLGFAFLYFLCLKWIGHTYQGLVISLWHHSHFKYDLMLPWFYRLLFFSSELHTGESVTLM